MKGSLAVALVIALVLTGGAVNVSAASTGNATTGDVTAAAPQKPDADAKQPSAAQASPQTSSTADATALPSDNQADDAMMQKIETICADPSSPACTAALSQIEPCGKPKAPALASAGHPQSSACSTN